MLCRCAGALGALLIVWVISHWFMLILCFFCIAFDLCKYIFFQSPLGKKLNKNLKIRQIWSISSISSLTFGSLSSYCFGKSRKNVSHFAVTWRAAKQLKVMHVFLLFLTLKQNQEGTGSRKVFLKVSKRLLCFLMFKTTKKEHSFKLFGIISSNWKRRLPNTFMEGIHFILNTVI